jgi:hypothetical protein
MHEIILNAILTTESEKQGGYALPRRCAIGQRS